MNAAECIVDCIKQEGIDVIAGVSGRPILALLQAMEKMGIRHIQTRHEQGAGFIADGYARALNGPGVAIVQRGPGVTNCITPIANAMIDGIPLIVLIGQGELEKFDKGALQELDHSAFLRYFVKWFFQLQDPMRIPEVMRRAFRTAVSGKPGPVVIELPMNLLEEETSLTEIYSPGGRRIPFGGDPLLIEKAAEEILKGKTPIVYAGGGVVRSSAFSELLALAEYVGLPVMTSLPGKSCFPENHPLSLGLGGFPNASYGTKQAVEMTRDADVVLALGSSFREHGTNYFDPMPPGKTIIQVDISEIELGKNYPVKIALLGDIKIVLQQLLTALQTLSVERKYSTPESTTKKNFKEDRKRTEKKIARLKKEWLTEWEEHLSSDARPIDPYRITREIEKNVDPDKTIFLQDAGLVRAYICHHLETRIPGTFMGYGGFSAMGYSIPAAIGVKLAKPEKQVIDIIGEGSFGMTGFEIETATRYGIKVIILLYNNGGMDAVRRLQTDRGETLVWDTVGGNYTEIARGMGAFAKRVSHPAEIAPSLEQAISQEKPAVIEFMVEKLVPTPSYRL